MSRREPRRDLDIRRAPYRDDKKTRHSDEAEDSLEARTRHVQPEGEEVNLLVFWLVIGVLAVGTLGLFVATFVVYELRGCQIAAVGVIVMAVAMSIAFHLSRENDEEVHVVFSIFLLPYWIVFALMNWDRYFLPFVISLFAALIFFVGLALQDRLSHWGKQSPHSVVRHDPDPAPPDQVPWGGHNPGGGQPWQPPPDPNPPIHVPPQPMRKPVGGDALVTYFSFDQVDPITGIVADQSGRGSHGRAYLPVGVPGVKNSSLAFNGERTRYFAYNQTDELNFDRGWDFTVCGWFNTRNGAGPILCQSNPAQVGPQMAFLKVELVGGKLVAEVLEDGGRNVVSLKGRTEVNNGEWRHFALLRKQGALALFQDGQLVATAINRPGSITTSYRTIGINLTGLELGQAAEINVFQGAIDEVRVYQRALSPDEINRLIQNP